MIEIVNIFLQLLIFLIVFSYPINKSLIKKIGFETFSLYEIYFFNFIIFSTLSLVFSIADLNYKYLFYFFIFFGTIYLIKNLITNFIIYKNFIFLLFLILNILLFFDIATFPILNWDGLATWSLKMNNFYLDQNYNNLDNLSYDHQPHLGPYLWALFLENTFLKYEYFGRLYYIFIFLLSIFCLNLNLSEDKNYFLKIFSISIIIFLSYDIFLFGGYQEYLIFSLILFCGIFLNKILTQNKITIYQILFFSIILNLILWSKQEGLAYIFILQIIFLFTSRISNFYKLISIIFFVIIISIKIQFSFNYLFYDPHFSFKLTSNFNYDLLFNKILFISKHILISFIKYPIWLIIIASYLFLFFTKRLKDDFINLIYLFAFLNFGLIYLVFLTTTSDFEWLVKTTLDRMIIQTTGFYLLIFSIFYKKIT